MLDPGGPELVAGQCQGTSRLVVASGGVDKQAMLVLMSWTMLVMEMLE